MDKAGRLYDHIIQKLKNTFIFRKKSKQQIIILLAYLHFPVIW